MVVAQPSAGDFLSPDGTQEAGGAFPQLLPEGLKRRFRRPAAPGRRSERDAEAMAGGVVQFEEPATKACS